MWEVAPLAPAPLPAPIFNPLTLITGDGGFWRADAGVTGTNPVTAWADQSSFANNLTGTGTITFSSTGFNGSKPGVTIAAASSSANNLTVTDTDFNSATVTAFMLIEFISDTAGGANRLLSIPPAGAGQDYNSPNGFLLATNGTAQFQLFGNSAEQGNGGAVNGSFSANGLYLLGGVFDGANANKWSAGAVVGSGTAWTTNIGSAGGAEFALGGATTGAGPCNFTTAFFGITQKAMNSSDWTNLKSYSNAIWGTSF